MQYWSSIIGLIISCGFVVGCGTSASGTDGRKVGYFDLTGYIKQITLDSQSVKVEKRVSIGESDETKVIDSYDFWMDELSFDGFDVNRPALLGKYTVDTIGLGPEYTEHYLAKDPQLRVTEMKVSHEGSKVSEIWIKSHSESFLEDMNIELSWKPGQSYHYLKTSDKIFSDPQEQLVIVRVIR